MLSSSSCRRITRPVYQPTLHTSRPFSGDAGFGGKRKPAVDQHDVSGDRVASKKAAFADTRMCGVRDDRDLRHQAAVNRGKKTPKKNNTKKPSRTVTLGVNGRRKEARSWSISGTP